MTVGNGKEGKGPSVAELQKYIRGKTKLEFILAGGERFTGILKWFDEFAFSLAQEEDNSITLLRSGVIGYRVAGKGKPLNKKGKE